jgi:hypothetical protein
MIDGQKIIAFTPVGRKRYMDLLAAHVKREHDAGHIDEWLLFNNAYVKEDSTYCDQLAAQWPWVKVLRVGNLSAAPGSDKFTWSRPEHIADFYKLMTEGDGVIYVRLDDDVVYIDENCIPALVKYRLENPKPFLVFPTIVNNVRTSFHMQEQGIVAKEWGIRNEMCDDVAWKHSDYIFQLHMKALKAIEEGNLVDTFALNTQTFDDPATVPEGDIWEAGHISINAFAIFGKDMLECKVAKDEEGYLSLWRPKELNRPNARAGEAVLIHFAYHTQTDFMDKTGVLNDYVKLAPPLGFRTVRLSPPLTPRGPTQPTQAQRARFQVRRPIGNFRRIGSPRGNPVRA